MEDRIYFLRVVLQMVYRDIYAYGKQFKSQMINSIFVYPVCFAIADVIIQSNVYFSSNNIIYATSLFASGPILPLLALSTGIMLDLSFDLDENRFIEYQMTIVPTQMLLAQKLLIGTVFSFILISLFFPVGLLLTHSYVDISQTDWYHLYSVLFFGAFCLSSYGLLAATFLTPKNIDMFWVRLNEPLLLLGGFWVPSSLLAKWWAPMKYVSLLNPLHYLSEGLRRAMTGSTEYMPVSTSMVGLSTLGILFFIGSLIQFKRRVDHI